MHLCPPVQVTLCLLDDEDDDEGEKWGSESAPCDFLFFSNCYFHFFFFNFQLIISFLDFFFFSWCVPVRRWNQHRILFLLSFVTNILWWNENWISPVRCSYLHLEAVTLTSKTESHLSSCSAWPQHDPGDDLWNIRAQIWCQVFTFQPTYSAFMLLIMLYLSVQLIKIRCMEVILCHINKKDVKKS